MIDQHLNARLKTLGWAGALGGIALVIAACGGGGDTASNATPAAKAAAGGVPAAPGAPTNDMGRGDKANLTGAGATFPAPIYQAWFDDYNKKVATGVRVNYQSIGSGGGIQQFTEKTVDFGATDAPMTEDELKKAGVATVHLPTVLGAVVATYNVEGLTATLKFDGDVLAKIYLGAIKKWNDPALAALNPGAKLPDANILVAYRSDGSGTTFVWTDFLSSVSADWKSKVGVNKNPNWPVGQGGKGNEGVTQVVSQTRNSIGYVELSYAIANKLKFADVKNKAGKFVTPSVESTSAAAAGVTLPADYRASIVNGEGEGTYPVASFTYLLVRQDAAKCASAAPLAHLLWWMYHDAGAQETAKGLLYAPLPPKVLPQVEATLEGLKCGGKTIL